MGVLPGGIFVDLVAAHRLTCHSVYRLQHLGADKFPWQEETLTEILLAHLTGLDYHIGADCPACPSSAQRCRVWSHTMTTQISGGLRLLTRPQEGGNKRLGRAGIGADFVYSLQHPSGRNELRLLIQAKRIRTGHPITADALPAAQRRDLLAASDHYHAAPYYLFYAESASAHHAHRTRCTVHTSAAETSIVLVPADVLTQVFDEEHHTSVSAAEVYAQGRTLLCMDGCGGAQPASAFGRLSRFVHDDAPLYQGADPQSESPPTRAVQVLTRASKPPRRAADSAIIRAGGRRGVQSGQILWVHLGDWAPEDSGERDGRGWFPEISPAQLADSARMYWKLDLHRAQDLRYLVASARGQIREVYRIIEDSLTVHHDAGDKISFDLEVLTPSSIEYRQVHQRTERYLAHRKAGARNVIGYP